MKKVYLSLAIAITASGSFAQAVNKIVQTPVNKSAKNVKEVNQAKAELWSNDFSTAADWTNTAISGSQNWVIGTSVPSGQFSEGLGAIASTTAANGYALFDSDQPGCPGNQNALLRNTTPINLSAEANVSIEFESYYSKYNGTAYVGFSTDATNWTYVAIHTNLGTNDVSENPEIISLPAPIIGGSSTAYICFRYQGSCDYAWMVDDVKITTTPDFDLKNTYSRHHTEMYQYSQIPLTQVAPTQFEAGIENLGSQSLTNIQLTVNVTGQETTTLNSPVYATLTAGQVDTLRISYTPTAVGTYNFSQAISLNETDENPANNTNLPTVSYAVTDFIYAVDKGSPYSVYPDLSTIYLGSTVPRNELGNSFDIFADQDLYGVDVHLATGTQVGAEIYGVLYEYNENYTSMANYWIATTNETDIFVIDANTTLNEFKTLQFPTPVALTAGGTYMLSIREAGSVGAKFSRSGFTTAGNQSWGIIQNENGVVWTALASAPVVRMNFNPSLSVKNSGELEGVKVYPNPSTGIVNISNDLNIENTIVVTDISGKIVTSKNASIATKVDLSSVGTGVYFVEISNTNGKKVERIVIQ